MTETIVITGASAGIGRATARLYGERGANVGLIARGQAGLDGAAADVAAAGGKALAVSADVADHGQLKEAARQVEELFGPIDVWINVAFTSVFAPFAKISPDEFRRVTEVSYLGFVHGTMVALEAMRSRDRGTIVQVGSALGERSIPLQSAYCGAKHAINGFTSSLRCELLHDNSGIHVTVVQMPAVNTPQFSWVRSKLPNHPQPVPPIYQPEVAARGVVFAADHPRRRQYWVGGSTAATLAGNRIIPALLDRYLARTGYASQQTSQKAAPERPDNLLQPADGADGDDYGAHGIFDSISHDRSPQLWLSQHARALITTAAAGTAILSGLTAARLVRGK
jgi:NAD(P)-dependent dehydrogenase (short-subunit alcohol dehydrogenase family)